MTQYNPVQYKEVLFMSNVAPIAVEFVNIVLSERAERDFVLDHILNNPGSTEEDAQKVLQHHKKGDGNFLPSLLLVKFIKFRRWSEKHEPGTALSPATRVVTIR